MPVLDIVLYPDAPLNDRAEPVHEFGPALVKLAKDMIETMKAEEGVGLAAPQIGLSKRIFVMCPPDGQARCVVNPELSEMEGREEGEEGCLSMPGIYATNVPRATRLRVRGLDELGQPVDFIVEHFEARIVHTSTITWRASSFQNAWTF
ncbi:MAG: peptide deformylase [Candidatus Competibacteraceae bacterium]|nr:peptide deformylase [Candidatus Competibacteraceae bacterium]